MSFSFNVSISQSVVLPQLGKNPVEEVVKAMTLDEKVNLLVGGGMFVPGMPMPGASAEPTEAQKRVLGAAGTTYAIPRLGIPAIVVCDGPAGVHAFNAGKSRLYYATAWPIGSLLASSWDVDLIKKVGAAYGNEAKEYGIDVILGPGMNIHRNPLGARNFEYYSEDPVITGQIASAMVNGIQSAGVGVSVKHFFANNQETNRMTVNTIMNERTMREIYLKGWQLVVRNSAPWTVMSSYNLVNGVYTSQNPELLNTILRKEWGFKGFVMTDWFGGKNVVEQMKAGNNLIIPGMAPQKAARLEAVKAGQLDEKILDQNITDILNIIQLTPIFKGYKFSDNPPLKENAQLSRQAAAESMVLLKNEGKTLPLSTGTKVAVFGNYSVQLVAGGTGSGDVNKMYTINLNEGLFKTGIAVDPLLNLGYRQYIATELAKKPKKNMMEEMMSPIVPIPEKSISIKEINQAVAHNDIVIIALGRNGGEGVDRKTSNDYYLTAAEKSLIKEVSQAAHAAKKKVIVTLNIGGVIDVAQWRDQVDAILLAWHPGLEGGNAMADIISGKVNPSGKLASSFPISYESDTTAKNFPGKEFPETARPGFMGSKEMDAEVVYEEGIYVGYRYYSSFGKKTAYEFGHGLSYSDFSFSNLKIAKPASDGDQQVSITVTNKGNYSGKEVAALYLSAPKGKLEKPATELKAFAKTKLLQPGESQEIVFTLSAADLASFHSDQSSWIAEAGDYKIRIGTSEKTFASGTFQLNKDVLVEKVIGKIQK